MDQMSGGQQQRVAIARAIVGQRRLILADEPTGALDSTTGHGVMEVLRARADSGSAVMLVTHEARHAAWADRVVFLRDGRIVDQAAAMHDPTFLLTQAGLDVPPAPAAGAGSGSWSAPQQLPHRGTDGPAGHRPAQGPVLPDRPADHAAGGRDDSGGDPVPKPRCGHRRKSCGTNWATPRHASPLCRRPMGTPSRIR